MKRSQKHPLWRAEMGPGMLRIQPRYLALAALLLCTEVLIARHTHGLLRGFVGDMLVVPLVYALLRATVQWPRGLAAGAALALACLVELLQGLGLPDLLHGLLPAAVQHHALYRVLQIALGSTFDPLDLLAYAVGFVLCLLRWPAAPPRRHRPQRAAWP